ncbi:LacI family DNA-binding transcriptional regulator [uncultured Bacteroides sp.]|uniref:LacI family DNA-binding transcriptional regulator n=1 Tax=uncultured Bacteroides sp. TaxID=162156 RepID=UPI002AA7D18D|nr:LacI family DNA-binding transcriptional regulator [uncultured Bacteroides sp.]
MNELPERIRIKDIARLADVSVGTVDRVIHGRSGVSESSKKRVEEILKQLDYQPNMYASALASNKKYLFICLLPQHLEGEYWTAVEKGLNDAVTAYSDFNLSMKLYYYDPYDYTSFISAGKEIIAETPDGVLIAPTVFEFTRKFTDQLSGLSIPYIFIDSNIPDLHPLAFYGQNSERSGYFAAKMLMLMAGKTEEIAIFRQIKEGIIGSNQQENREKGFRTYMNEHFPSCHIAELNLQPKSPNEDEQLLDAFFEEHPSLTCGITFNSKVHIVGEYLEEKNIKKLNLIGYDLLERNVACLKNGSVSMLIAQQPEIQGYNSIKALCDQLIFKKEVNTINYMPIDLLTAETVDFYLDFQK